MVNGTFAGCAMCFENNPRMKASRLSFHVTQKEQRGYNTRGGRWKQKLLNISFTENKKLFDEIYEKRVWGTGGGGSGDGSMASLAVVTSQILRLVAFKYNILSVIDAPCGHAAYSWTAVALSHLFQEIPCFVYHGIDVVDSIILSNLKYFSADVRTNRISFATMDLSAEDAVLPRGFDLIFSRDALQHLSYAGIAGVLATFCRSDAMYLLVGSYDANPEGTNKDVPSTLTRMFEINLLQQPFNFSEVLEVFYEPLLNAYKTGDNYRPKFLRLYRLASLCASNNLKSFVKTYAVTRENSTYTQ